jgi:hypothetical protein
MKIKIKIKRKEKTKTESRILTKDRVGKMFMRLESQNEMIKFFTSILVSAPKINTQT